MSCAFGLVFILLGKRMWHVEVWNLRLETTAGFVYLLRDVEKLLVIGRWLLIDGFILSSEGQLRTWVDHILVIVRVAMAYMLLLAVVQIQIAVLWWYLRQLDRLVLLMARNHGSSRHVKCRNQLRLRMQRRLRWLHLRDRTFLPFDFPDHLILRAIDLMQLS